MTWEELEEGLARWEKQLREIREFFDAINENLKGDQNATDKEKR